MKIIHHPDADSFLAAAGPFLAAREVENGLIRDIANKARECGGAAVLATVEDRGTVIGAAVQTPPRKLVVSHLPPGAGEMLADFLHRSGVALPGVLGPEPGVTELGRRWAELTGAAIIPGMKENLYRCDRLLPPPPVSGVARRVRPDEADMAADWTRRFVTEVGLSEEELAAAGDMARESVAAGRLWWWDDGGPVAMTGIASDNGRACRINAVMTRPDCRGRGYGAAIVGHVTGLCLERGRYCYLHADADYPISNRLYQRLGYVLIAAEQELIFRNM